MGDETRLTYQAERAALLQAIVRQARADGSVIAAWLFGSLGRGDGDALSDLDVWLVVPDAYIQDAVARRREWVTTVGAPVLLQEAPQNAPPAGGYLLAYYDAPTAPHQVDWYWQPQSRARVPAETRLLLDRANLPRDSAPTQLVAGDPPAGHIEEPLNSISFFWAMLMICAKKDIYRSPAAAEMRLVRHVVDGLNRVQAKLGLPLASFPTIEPPGIPAKLAALRALAQQMEAATRRAADQGLAVPERAAPAAREIQG